MPKQFLNQRKITTSEVKELYQLAQFGKLSSGLFHDILNPITSLILGINCLTQQNAKKHKMLSESCESLQSYIQSIRKILSFEKVHTTFNIRKEIDSAIRILQYQFDENSIKVHIKAPNIISYTGNPFSLHRVLTNILSNAIDALVEKEIDEKIITITCKLSKNANVITIHDNGDGIPPHLLPAVCSPFVTTKNGKGLGLGLSICREIVEKECKGNIVIKSSKQEGTTINLLLPHKIPRT